MAVQVYTLFELIVFEININFIFKRFKSTLRIYIPSMMCSQLFIDKHHKNKQLILDNIIRKSYK